MDPAHRDAVAVGFAVPSAAGSIVRPHGGVSMSETASVGAKATILIVDDEPDVREVLEEYFVAHGYAAMGAESASAAKAMAAAHPIDLALVDIHMPGEDGLESCAAPARALREDRDRHADFRRHGGRPDRGPRDGRRRLRPQALRPARAGGARQERAAPHVGRGTRRPRRRSACASDAACSTSTAHRLTRRERERRWRCPRWSSIC